MKLELNRFDMKNIKSGSTIVFIGKRNTGKSILCKDLFRHNTDWPVGVIISATEKANHFFEKFIPKMLIYDEYDSSIVNKFLERQEKITNQHEAEKKKYGGTDLDPRAFLVLDDCLYDKTWPNDKNIRSIFMNGRHYNVTFILTMQYSMGIPPHLRSNIDYVFLLRDPILKNQERLYNQYAGMFPSFEIFRQVFNQCTENYECMVIDNKVQSNKLSDQVYWYKADIGSDFKVCSRELWDIDEREKERQMYHPDEEPEEDDEDFDAMTIHKRKNKNAPIIKVKKGTKMLM